MMALKGSGLSCRGRRIYVEFGGVEVASGEVGDRIMSVIERK